MVSAERFTNRITAADAARRGDVFYLQTRWKHGSGMRYDLVSMQPRAQADGTMSFELQEHTDMNVYVNSFSIQPVANAEHRRLVAHVRCMLTVTIFGWKGYAISGLVETCEAKWLSSGGACTGKRGNTPVAL